MKSASATDAVPTAWRRPALKPFLAYLLSAIFLTWVFHDTHPQRIIKDFATLDWRWIPPAILCDVLGFVCQGIRWRTLLAPVGDLSLPRATQAIYIALFANEIVPLRLGELARAYFAGRWIARPLAEVVPSMLVERLIDAIWLALSVALAAVLVSLPARIDEIAGIFGMVVLLLTTAFVVLILRCPQASSSSFKPGSRLRLLISTFAEGLRQIGNSKTLWKAGFVSAGCLAFQAVAFYLVMRGYRLELPLSAGIIVYLIVRLGTIIPNAPANVGSFQLFTVFGLMLFGIDKTEAAGFSIVVFLILTVPLWTLGSLALSLTGMSLSDLRAAWPAGTVHSTGSN